MSSPSSQPSNDQRDRDELARLMYDGQGWEASYEEAFPFEREALLDLADAILASEVVSRGRRHAAAEALGSAANDLTDHNGGCGMDESEWDRGFSSATRDAVRYLRLRADREVSR